ncbi:MAG: GNAT family N-acetyltransferase [Saprospiraceae bacterium]
MAIPIVRPIRPTDNASVAQIIRTVMPEFGCVGPGFSIEDPEVDDMYHAYQGERAAFYVVELEGQILGCGGFAPLAGGDPGICELKKMYFLSSLRGMGMGHQMIEQCLEDARKAGFHTMYLETVYRMEAANALYQKKGFTACPQMGNTGHSGCDTFYTLSLT